MTDECFCSCVFLRNYVINFNNLLELVTFPNYIIHATLLY